MTGCPPLALALRVTDEPLQTVCTSSFTESGLKSLRKNVLSTVLVVEQTVVLALKTRVSVGSGSPSEIGVTVIGGVCKEPAGMVSTIGKTEGVISAEVAVEEGSMSRVMTNGTP